MVDSQDGWTALITAANRDHEGCVRLLVEAGADRSIKSTGKGNEGKTSLDHAKTETIKVILNS